MSKFRARRRPPARGHVHWAARYRWRALWWCAIIVVGTHTHPAHAGPYPPTGGHPGTNAIPLIDARINPQSWPVEVTSLTRGPQDIANPTGPVASFGSPSTLTQPYDGSTYNVVSLGDGGSVTLRFDPPIRNGIGPDFCVFENAFESGGGYAFLELAYVDVSSDGVNFFRFPSVSLTPADDPDLDAIGEFGTLDPTDIYNLAGRDIRGYGTPFELTELIGVSPLLDVMNVRYVRLTDVVGAISPVGGFSPSLDSRGYPINDPYPTPYTTGGFDLGGVANLSFPALVPEPASLLAAAGALVMLRRFR